MEGDLSSTHPHPAVSLVPGTFFARVAPYETSRAVLDHPFLPRFALPRGRRRRRPDARTTTFSRRPHLVGERSAGVGRPGSGRASVLPAEPHLREVPRRRRRGPAARPRPGFA